MNSTSSQKAPGNPAPLNAANPMDPALAANSSTTPLQPSNDGPTSSTSNGIVDQITPTHYPTTSTTPKYQSQLQSPSSRPVSQGPPPREELKADSFSLYQASKEDLSLGASTPTPTPSLRSFSASSTTSSKSYKSKLSSAKTTLRSLTKNFFGRSKSNQSSNSTSPQPAARASSANLSLRTPSRSNTTGSLSTPAPPLEKSVISSQSKKSTKSLRPAMQQNQQPQPQLQPQQSVKPSTLHKLPTQPTQTHPKLYQPKSAPASPPAPFPADPSESFDDRYKPLAQQPPKLQQHQSQSQSPAQTATQLHHAPYPHLPQYPQIQSTESPNPTKPRTNSVSSAKSTSSSNSTKKSAFQPENTLAHKSSNSFLYAAIPSPANETIIQQQLASHMPAGVQPQLAQYMQQQQLTQQIFTTRQRLQQQLNQAHLQLLLAHSPQQQQQQPQQPQQLQASLPTQYPSGQPHPSSPNFGLPNAPINLSTLGTIPTRDTRYVAVIQPHPLVGPYGLTINRGEVLKTKFKLDSGWCDGVNLQGKRGWFPIQYTIQLTPEQADLLTRRWKGELTDAENVAFELPPQPDKAPKLPTVPVPLIKGSLFIQAMRSLEKGGVLDLDDNEDDEEGQYELNEQTEPQPPVQQYVPQKPRGPESLHEFSFSDPAIDSVITASRSNAVPSATVATGFPYANSSNSPNSPNSTANRSPLNSYGAHANSSSSSIHSSTPSSPLGVTPIPPPHIDNTTQVSTPMPATATTTNYATSSTVSTPTAANHPLLPSHHTHSPSLPISEYMDPMETGVAAGASPYIYSINTNCVSPTSPDQYIHHQSPQNPQNGVPLPPTFSSASNSIVNRHIHNVIESSVPSPSSTASVGPMDNISNTNLSRKSSLNSSHSRGRDSVDMMLGSSGLLDYRFVDGETLIKLTAVETAWTHNNGANDSSGSIPNPPTPNNPMGLNDNMLSDLRTYWNPYASDQARMYYYNPHLKIVTDNLPFEKISAQQAAAIAMKGLPLRTPGPNDLEAVSEQVGIKASKSLDHIKASPLLLNTAGDPYKDLLYKHHKNYAQLKKGRAGSIDSINSGISLSSSLMIPFKYTDGIESLKTWSAITNRLDVSSAKMIAALTSRDVHNIQSGYEILTTLVAHISYMSGIPPGTIPAFVPTNKEFSRSYRRMLTALSKLALSVDIAKDKTDYFNEYVKKPRSSSVISAASFGAQSLASSAASTISYGDRKYSVISELSEYGDSVDPYRLCARDTKALVKSAKGFIKHFKSLLRVGSLPSSGTQTPATPSTPSTAMGISGPHNLTSPGRGSFSDQADDSISVASRGSVDSSASMFYPVRQFRAGTWSQINVSPISMSSSANSGVIRVPRRPSVVPLESYDSFIPLDHELISVLEHQRTVVINILRQIFSLIGDVSRACQEYAREEAKAKAKAEAEAAAAFAAAEAAIASGEINAVKFVPVLDENNNIISLNPTLSSPGASNTSSKGVNAQGDDNAPSAESADETEALEDDKLILFISSLNSLVAMVTNICNLLDSLDLQMYQPRPQMTLPSSPMPTSPAPNRRSSGMPFSVTSTGGYNLYSQSNAYNNVSSTILLYDFLSVKQTLYDELMGFLYAAGSTDIKSKNFIKEFSVNLESVKVPTSIFQQQHQIKFLSTPTGMSLASEIMGKSGSNNSSKEEISLPEGNTEGPGIHDITSGGTDTSIGPTDTFNENDAHEAEVVHGSSEGNTSSIAEGVSTNATGSSMSSFDTQDSDKSRISTPNRADSSSGVLAEIFEGAKICINDDERLIKMRVMSIGVAVDSVVYSAMLLADERNALLSANPSSIDQSVSGIETTSSAVALPMSNNTTATGNGSIGDVLAPGSIRSNSFPARINYSGLDRAASFGSSIHSTNEGSAASGTVADGTTTPNSTLAREESQPWFLKTDFQSEILFDSKKEVKGGTPQALVEHLTQHNSRDSTFISSFLLTFRTMMSPHQLFQMLVARYGIQPPEGLSPDEFHMWTERKQKPIRFRVANTFKKWLEEYWFEDPNSKSIQQLLQAMMNFTLELERQNSPGYKQIRNQIELKMKHDYSVHRRIVQNTPANPPPVPILPQSLKKIKFSDLDPLELARQLTLREFMLFEKITPFECLTRRQSRSKARNNTLEGTPHIDVFIQNSNDLTNWVGAMILSYTDARKRSQAIKYFTNVAEYCRQYNNFSSMMAIISAISSATIHRLKKTWEHVTEKTNFVLQNMNRLMNSSRNFNEYREILRMVSPPLIPFFGVYLTDLTFLEDANSDFLQENPLFINFSKRMKAADIIRDIMQYQAVTYAFQEVPEIQQLLSQGFEQVESIDAQYDLSLALEPRVNTEERVSKLLQETGFL